MFKKISWVNLYLILTAIINPLLAFAQPDLLIISVFLEFIILFTQKDNKIFNLWKIFILSSIYFGVSILGIKLYDIVLIIIVLSSLLGTLKSKMKLKKSIFIKHIEIYYFIIYLTCILIYQNSNSQEFMEYTRYIMSFLIVIIFAYSNLSVEYVKKLIKFTPVVAVKNFISGVLIFILSNVKGHELSTNSSWMNFKTHYNQGELRLVGFYSDPNKYYLFFIVTFLLIEMYKNALNTKLEHEKIIKTFLIVGIISSFSRTAIIIVILLVFTEILKLFIPQKFQKLKVVFYWLLALLFFLSIDILMEFMNKLLYNLTIVMGRESSLIYSSSIEESSRIIASKIALGSIKQNMFFGNGFFTWNELYYMPPHNTFIFILQDIGIVGLLLYFICIMSIRYYLRIEIIIALLILPSITLDLQNFRLLYFVLALSIFFRYENESVNNLRRRQ
ncbi:O-antigen ligase family protein [Gracilibacillus salinarum]|uniref:O-antigen ligase-related domain-containing protein n=1 Tax=Gracilibacillus salinarum TaxID=2932255 RepID=A0ABY4GRL1_9BACI|nr:O-antigen ligase family protein [Gracilibacillus salinarum]UOQ87012.1 hypothetical protein MUN87_09070 [Gracilibacillus salinarum]